MSYSISTTESATFTVTHARHIAAKVATDLKRLQRLYGVPSDASITDFEAEAIELLRNGYLKKVIYGFQRNESWIEPTLRYTAEEISNNGIDDDPGRIRPGLDVTDTVFHSYLVRTAAWHNLPATDQAAFNATLPFQRGTAAEPQVANGYFADDRIYSAGGRTLNRATVRSFS